MILCYDNSVIFFFVWFLGLIGKVFVVNYLVRYKILVYFLLLIDFCIFSMILRLGYLIKDYVM